MNPSYMYSLSDEQKIQYAAQPDNISSFETKMREDHELSQSVDKTSLRFWLNDLATPFNLHWHTTIELVVPIEGTYTVIADNVTYELEEGDIMIIPSGTLHSIPPAKKGCRFIYLFEMEPFVGFQNYPYIRSLLTDPIVITADTHPELYPTAISLVMEAAKEYWDKEKAYKELTVYAVMMKLLAEYGNYRRNFNDSVDRTSSTPHELTMRLNRVYQYISEHMSENIQLEDAAKVANYSIYHFSRIFKESTGQTFSDYLRHLRIRAAQQLLQQMDAQIIWIAHECGFSSISTFNRTFRNVTGSTPSEYRSLCSQRNN